MNKTKIEWVRNPDGTPGYSWNPLTGCLNGCPYCYARKLANTRLKDKYLANGNYVKGYLEARGALKEGAILPSQDPFYPRFWEDRMKQMYRYTVTNLDLENTKKAKAGKPKGIFVCDMSDLFGIGIPEIWTQSVLNQVKNWPEYRFYLLTKQPQNLQKFSPFPDNCWVGVSATNAQMFIDAGNALEGIEAKIKYISAEPLLSWNLGGSGFIATMLQKWGIGWVIIGAQTKPYKPPKIEWVKEIVSACDKAGIPVFLKDNLLPLMGGYPIPKQNMWAYKFDKGKFELRQEMPTTKV